MPQPPAGQVDPDRREAEPRQDGRVRTGAAAHVEARTVAGAQQVGDRGVHARGVLPAREGVVPVGVRVVRGRPRACLEVLGRAEARSRRRSGKAAFRLDTGVVSGRNANAAGRRLGPPQAGQALRDRP